MGKKVDINSVTEQYASIAEKFILDARDVEFLFLKTLCDFFGTSDVAIESEGVRIDGKYRNIRFADFGKIINKLETECNNRSFSKKEAYILSFFAANRNVVFGKIVSSDSYSYTLKVMLSKDSMLRYTEPIRIERNGESIPDFISVIPIEILPLTIGRNPEKNIFNFKAKILTSKTIEVHLARITKNLEKNFKASVRIELKYYDRQRGIIYLKDVGDERVLHFAIVKYYMRYFGMFGVKTIIDTEIKRK